MDLKTDLAKNYVQRDEDNKKLLERLKSIDENKTPPAIFDERYPKLSNNLKTALGATAALGLGLDNYSEDEDSENEETSENQDEKEDNLNFRGGKRKGAAQKRKIYSKKYNKKTKIKKNSLRLKSIKRTLRKSFKKTPKKNSKKNNYSRYDDYNCH